MGHIPQGKPAADQQMSQSLTISIVYYLLHSGNQKILEELHPNVLYNL